AAKLREDPPQGIILSGGPNSVFADGAPGIDPEIFGLGIPILGICYGCQLLCDMLGGTVSSCENSEYGRIDLQIDEPHALFDGIPRETQVLMSHTDKITALPADCLATAHTADCEVAAFTMRNAPICGVQFHPEVEISVHGTVLLHNFLYRICQADGDYSMEDYLKTQIEAVRAQVGQEHVILGLSGGVDSSVCAALLSAAIPGQLTCIYIDHGFMRKNETEEIEKAFADRALDFVRVDASERFLRRITGVTEPEEKRKRIGDEFVRVFQDEAKKHSGAKFLAQGTIYPDVVESGKNKSAVIKSHHNVGGLPEDLGFRGVVEPLRGLFKDEVREIGRMLGLPSSLVERQPFPGPGLAIRVIGEVTREKCDILRDADLIFREELDRAAKDGLTDRADQYFAVLTDTKSVGVMGDFRTYEYTLVLRAVRTSDFMTCEFARLPWDVLAKASARITGEVRGVNRVVYDVTSKPPATIEWE
ncbi:MAG: glutamine-hydrolyzing GMP synthase, partial [Clostridia bacterium]|nr:glutamine-hydrolyzing GMP synthase [Clostridia bacterium]